MNAQERKYVSLFMFLQTGKNIPNYPETVPLIYLQSNGYDIYFSGRVNTILKYYIKADFCYRTSKDNVWILIFYVYEDIDMII